MRLIAGTLAPINLPVHSVWFIKFRISYPTDTTRKLDSLS